MAGRRPKPTAVKELEGRRGHRTKAELAAKENEPKPEISWVMCPEYLTESAKKSWNRIYPELERTQIITVIDTDAFAARCQLFGYSVDLMKEIKRDGIFIDDERNPKISELRQILQQLRLYDGEFGLTPSSRSRISVPKVEDKTDDILD